MLGKGKRSQNAKGSPGFSMKILSRKSSPGWIKPQQTFNLKLVLPGSYPTPLPHPMLPHPSPHSVLRDAASKFHTSLCQIKTSLEHLQGLLWNPRVWNAVLYLMLRPLAQVPAKCLPSLCWRTSSYRKLVSLGAS